MALPVKIESEMFSELDLGDLSEISEELSHAYATRQIFRTDTEARISVLDDIHFPTKAAKYWQSVREQTTMLEQLALLSFDYRRNETNIKRYNRDISAMTDEFDLEDAKINLDECLFKRANMKSIAADRTREIRMWSTIKKELNDGTFDINDVNTHQLISYTTRFALMADTVNPEQMSGDEYANLLGQLNSSLALCKKMGVLDRVSLPPSITKQLNLGN